MADDDVPASGPSSPSAEDAHAVRPTSSSPEDPPLARPSSPADTPLHTRPRLRRHRHRHRRRHLAPGVADFNAHHRSILAHSNFTLGPRETTRAEDTTVRSPRSRSPCSKSSCSSASESSLDEAHESQVEVDEDTLITAGSRIVQNTQDTNTNTPPAPQLPRIVRSRIVVPPSPSLDILNTQGYCRSSLSSVETYPPRRSQHRKGSYSSEDSHRTVPKRRVPGARRRSGGIPLQEGLSPGIPFGNSPSLPSYGSITGASSEKASAEGNKMYLETKINMVSKFSSK